MAPMHEHMCRRAVLLLALARAASCALTGLQLTRQGCVCISDCSANTVADPWCWVMGPDGGYARRQDQGSCGDWYEGRGDRESGWFDRCEVKQVAPYEPHGVLGDQAYPAPFILLQQDLPFHINIASIPYCLHGEDGDCHDSWHAVPREPWVRYATSWQCVACKQLVSVTWHREFCAPYADMTILTVYDRRRNMVVMSFQGTVDQTHLQISLQMRKEFPYRQLGPAWQKAGWHGAPTAPARGARDRHGTRLALATDAQRACPPRAPLTPPLTAGTYWTFQGTRTPTHRARFIPRPGTHPLTLSRALRAPVPAQSCRAPCTRSLTSCTRTCSTSCPPRAHLGSWSRGTRSVARWR